MQIYVSRNGEQYGPYTKVQFYRMVEEGSLASNDLACHDMHTWVPVSDLLNSASVRSPSEQQYSSPVSSGNSSDMHQYETGIGEVSIHREPKLTGSMYLVEIIIDGRTHAKLKSNARMTAELEPGDHWMQAIGGGLSRVINFHVEQDRELAYKTYFSNWGILGGGLKIVPI
jgi:hypothetical protein